MTDRTFPKPSGPLQNIVLVDDEPSVLFALKLLMEAVGYKVQDFGTPAEALEFLTQNENCELFICDLRMPKMNGLMVLEQAKRIRPEIPFILMSAHANPQEQEQAQKLGSFGFLGKPFMPEQLHDVVRQIQEAANSDAA